ncbi:hypothetical protein CBL_04313 [Carabus blaptoides fortunei]
MGGLSAASKGPFLSGYLEDNVDKYNRTQVYRPWKSRHSLYASFQPTNRASERTKDSNRLRYTPLSHAIIARPAQSDSVTKWLPGTQQHCRCAGLNVHFNKYLTARPVSDYVTHRHIASLHLSHHVKLENSEEQRMQRTLCIKSTKLSSNRFLQSVTGRKIDLDSRNCDSS